MNDGEKREVAVELTVPQVEEEEGVNKQSTTILEQVRHFTQALNSHLIHAAAHVLRNDGLKTHLCYFLGFVSRRG